MLTPFPFHLFPLKSDADTEEVRKAGWAVCISGSLGAVLSHLSFFREPEAFVIIRGDNAHTNVAWNGDPKEFFIAYGTLKDLES